MAFFLLENYFVDPPGRRLQDFDQRIDADNAVHERPLYAYHIMRERDFRLAPAYPVQKPNENRTG
jgi:hypothetical protein